MPLETLVTGRIATFAGASGYGWVEAIGIRDGKVAFAGSAVELETRADPHTRRIELEPGEIAIPGLIDAHLHFAGAAMAATQVDLTGAQTVDEGLAMIADAAARVAAPGWILGGGWDQRRWGRWPTADDLERVAPGRLVALRAFDHHALWASSAALAAAGIDRATADPAGGVILRGDDGRAGGRPPRERWRAGRSTASRRPTPRPSKRAIRVPRSGAARRSASSGRTIPRRSRPDPDEPGARQLPRAQ